MASLDRAKIRKFALDISGLTFLVIAILAIFFPREVAKAYGFALDNIEAFDEFRAIFTGFWTGLAILLFTAAKRMDNVTLGNMGGLLILCQSLGRVLSFFLDGKPNLLFEISFVLELSLSLAILLSRPKERSD